MTLGILSYYRGVPFLDLMELKTIDLRFKSRGKITPLPHVALAVIDEKSLAAEGKWVWPRSKIANLVTKLSELGAKVIVFDIGFFEPNNNETLKTIQKIENRLTHLFKNDIKILKQMKSKADHDQLMAEAIKKTGAKIVLGYFFQTGPSFPNSVNKQNVIKGSTYKLVHYSSEKARRFQFIEAKNKQANLPLFTSAASCSGFFNMFPDADGVYRSVPGVLKFGEKLYAPLSIIAASTFLGASPSLKVADYGVEQINVGNIAIPTDEHGRIFINYRGTEKTFPHISVTDILNNRISEKSVKDKIIIVGTTATGLSDLRVIPLENVFPGVEIHANIIDSILARDFLVHPEWIAIFDISAIICTCLLLGFILAHTRIIIGIVTGLAFFTGYIILCRHLFTAQGLILNMVYPLAIAILLYITIPIYKYFAETRQKRFIQNAFGTYLAPSVVKQLIDSPEKLELGGEKREITAFFSDLQGFTGISEKLAPDELVELLNEFLSEMTDIILANNGTVDKFEGDAIIAFFGAPNILLNHAETACATAIKMQKRLALLRKKWKKENKPELFMRTGLCTGKAVVGNMGSKNRMDYTMMGDTVNTAARLEGVNKLYGTYSLISETTYLSAGNNTIAREIDSINMAGKKKAVTIYELLGFNSKLSENITKTTELYTNGLYIYRNRNWDKAAVCFQAALDLTPDDGPSITMLQRCHDFKRNPPDENWNSVFEINTK